MTTAANWKPLEKIGVTSDFTAVDTTKLVPLGTRVKVRDVGSTDYGEAELIYLSGVASTVRGSVVLITDTYGTSLIAARAIGAVAVALAAVTASTSYGWYQIRGKGVAACDTVAANAACYIDGTAGRIDDAAVAGDAVVGMRTVSADSSNLCVVNMLCNPSVGDFDNA